MENTVPLCLSHRLYRRGNVAFLYYFLLPISSSIFKNLIMYLCSILCESQAWLNELTRYSDLAVFLPFSLCLQNSNYASYFVELKDRYV